MQVPLEIAFHHFPSSEWAETEIRKRVAKLDKLYDRLVSCRVRVEQRATNPTGTIPPVVRIDMGVPGHKHLVVTHEPDRLLQKFQTPDLHNAIHEAFNIAEQKLVEYKKHLQDRGKDGQHDVENQHLGQVAEIHPEADFGFLLTGQGSLLYFHRNSVLSGDFDAFKRGDQLSYVEDVGDTGPLATKVRARAE
jgi:hypothetical protein